MKYCPKCHNEYVDSLNFCTQCGCPLEKLEEGSSVPDYRSEASLRTTRPRKKGSIWRRLFVAFLVVIALLVGAYNYVSNLTTYMGLNPNRVVAPKGGGKAKVAIEYDGFLWEIKSHPEWVTVHEGSDSFVVDFEKNASGRNRSGIITVQSGKVLAKVAIAQRAAATTVNVSKSVIHFSKAGGVDSLQVRTDGFNWQAEYPGFVTAEKSGDHTLILKAPRNDGYAKSGYLVVNEDYERKIVTIVQGGVCENCKGKGEIVCPICHGNSYSYFNCFGCGGRGIQTCNVCEGRGEID